MGANTIGEQLRLSGWVPKMSILLPKDAPQLGYYVGFIQKKCRVKKVRENRAVASTGTIDVRKIPSGTVTVAGSAVGTRIIESTINVATTAGTPNEKDPATGSASVLEAGDTVFVYTSAALTNLEGCVVEIELEPMDE